MKFVLTFTKDYLTLIEINGITLNFGSTACKIKVGIVHVNTKSARKMSDVQLLSHALTCTYVATTKVSGYKHTQVISINNI